MNSSDLIHLTLNGETRTCAAGTLLSVFVNDFDLPDKGVAIEISGAIIPRGKWSETVIQPQDTIEIVHMVGGG